MSDKNILEQLVDAIRGTRKSEGNPYHDARGRFASGGKAVHSATSKVYSKGKAPVPSLVHKSLYPEGGAPKSQKQQRRDWARTVKQMPWLKEPTKKDYEKIKGVPLGKLL